MQGRFTVLASGSSGNAALLEVGDFGLLIDCGVHPRMLTARLAEVGANWDSIKAVILTHTHGDHWKDAALADLRSRKIPLWAHAAHHDDLARAATAFESLRRASLLREYEADRLFQIAPGLNVRPSGVSHDSEPTFAFRIDHHWEDNLAWSVGYASDLGCVSSELIELYAGVDVLALEYNHDVKMERASRRPRFLIERVLGDYGHLSNEQAGELTAAIAARSGTGFPAHLVQLHLSRECNRPALAAAAGRAALRSLNPKTEIITAKPDAATRSIPLARSADADRRLAARALPAVAKPPRTGCTTPSLPGLEG